MLPWYVPGQGCEDNPHWLKLTYAAIWGLDHCYRLSCLVKHRSCQMTDSMKTKDLVPRPLALNPSI